MQKDTIQASVSKQSAEMETPAIEVKDLSKSFGSFRAVDHLSLSVRRGEIFGLLGPNGSGKTTTINMISGLSHPTSGEVRVMGYDVRHNSCQVRQILGSVPQKPRFMRNFRHGPTWIFMPTSSVFHARKRRNASPACSNLCNCWIAKIRASAPSPAV